MCANQTNAQETSDMDYDQSRSAPDYTATQAQTQGVNEAAVRNLRTLEDVEITRPKFLYSNLLVEGVINIVAGEGGIGKSTLVLDWVAKLTTGELDGDYRGTPLNICLYSPEESEGMLKARLLAANADTSKITPMGNPYKREGAIEQTLDFTLPANINAIRNLLSQSEAKVLVIDPLSNLVNGDSNKLTDVRRALNPLAALADSMKVTVIGVLHFGKGQGRSARNMVSGSKAYNDICRSMLSMARDNEDDKVIVSHEKANYIALPNCQRDWSFSLESVELEDTNNEPISVGRVVNWQPSSKSVDCVLGEETRRHGKQPNEQQSFLIDLLNSKARRTPDGKRMGLPRREIEQAADGRWTSNQLTDARRRCTAMTIDQQRIGKIGWWLLPESRQSEVKTESTADDAHSLASWQNGKINPKRTSHTPTSENRSTTQKDKDTWYKELSPHIGEVDFKCMEDWQLRIICEKRAGLWKSSAQEELGSRERNTMETSDSQSGPQERA